MKNILIILTGLLDIAGCGAIATKTVYFGVAVVCWFVVIVGAHCVLDGVKGLIKK